MWRQSTIDAKILILEDKRSNVENGILECIKSGKDRKFSTVAADYLIMQCLRKSSQDYYFSICNFHSVHCGMIGKLGVWEFIRIKGLLYGLSVLVSLSFKGARSSGTEDNIKRCMFGNAITKAWETLYKNDFIIASMDEDIKNRVGDVLYNIAESIIKSAAIDSKLHANKWLSKLVEDNDVLSIFLGFMSFDNMIFDYNHNIDTECKKRHHIHIISRVTFMSQDEDVDLKKKYSESLSALESVISIFKNTDYMYIRPNEKYFFSGSIGEHRDSCFSTLNVINKLLHRCINNMVKVCKEEESENEN